MSTLPTGTKAERFVTWQYFHAFWEKHNPQIKVRKKGTNIYTDCLTLLFSFNFIHNIDQSSSGGNKSGTRNDGIIETKMENALARMEAKRMEAKIHVKKYQGQWKEANWWYSISRINIKNALSDIFQRFSVNIDVGQNVQMPNLEADQCGDAYYIFM